MCYYTPPEGVQRRCARPGNGVGAKPRHPQTDFCGRGQRTSAGERVNTLGSRQCGPGRHLMPHARLLTRITRPPGEGEGGHGGAVMPLASYPRTAGQISTRCTGTSTSATAAARRCRRLEHAATESSPSHPPTRRRRRATAASSSRLSACHALPDDRYLLLWLGSGVEVGSGRGGRRICTVNTSTSRKSKPAARFRSAGRRTRVAHRSIGFPVQAVQK